MWVCEICFVQFMQNRTRLHCYIYANMNWFNEYGYKIGLGMRNEYLYILWTCVFCIYIYIYIISGWYIWLIPTQRKTHRHNIYFAHPIHFALGKYYFPREILSISWINIIDTYSIYRYIYIIERQKDDKVLPILTCYVM